MQAYALALTLGFIGLIVAAAGIAGERDENVFGRLTRGLVRLWELVGEKIAFVAVVGGAIGLLLAVVFGLVVEFGNVAGGEPWGRLPLVVIGLVLGAAAFGALGVLIGSLAREARCRHARRLPRGAPHRAARARARRAWYRRQAASARRFRSRTR